MSVDWRGYSNTHYWKIWKVSGLESVCAGRYTSNQYISKKPCKVYLCLQGFFLTAKKSKIRTLNFVEMKRGSFFGSLVSGRKENFRQKKGFWLRSFNSFWGGLKVKYFNIDGLSSHGWNTDFFDWLINTNYKNLKIQHCFCAEQSWNFSWGNSGVKKIPTK